MQLNLIFSYARHAYSQKYKNQNTITRSEL